MPKTKKYSTHNNMTYHSQLNMWQSDSARFRRGESLRCPASGSLWEDVPDVCSPLQKYKSPCNKKKLLFVTLNFNETKVTPCETVKLVKDILYHASVSRGVAYWEWRKNDPNETASGLHCHIVLEGVTKRIIERCRRCSKGAPYSELCQAYGTLKKYPARYYSEKVDYCYDTNTASKSEQKRHNVELRKKFNLPNLSK